jgi:outer membrane protein assembly factor BamA
MYLSYRSTFFIIAIVVLSLFGAEARVFDVAQKPPAEDSNICYIIESIKIKGNRKTKPFIITRELDFKAGDTLCLNDTAALFTKSRNTVFNTRLFVWVRIELDEPTTIGSIKYRNKVVTIEVKERWYTFPNPIFELADRNFNEWWYDRNRDLRRTNIGMRFVQFNCRGRNEDLKTTVQLGFTPRVDVFYTIPYINKSYNDGLRMGVSYSTNRQVAVQTLDNKLDFRPVVRTEATEAWRRRFYGLLAYNKRRGLFQNQILEARFHHNEVSDSVAIINPNYFGDGRRFQRFTQLSYTYLYDFRNIRQFALKGFYFLGLIEKIGVLPSDMVDITSIRIAAAKYFDVGHNFYFASRFEGDFSYPALQPYANTRVLGYETRFVRGYERKVVEGMVPVCFRNSLRKKVFGKVVRNSMMPIEQFRTIPIDIYLHGIADAGYVHNPKVLEANKRLTNTLLFGTGIGVSLVTYYDAVVRFEYTFTRHQTGGFFLAFATDI